MKQFEIEKTNMYVPILSVLKVVALGPFLACISRSLTCKTKIWLVQQSSFQKGLENSFYIQNCKEVNKIFKNQNVKYLTNLSGVLTLKKQELMEFLR